MSLNKIMIAPIIPLWLLSILLFLGLVAAIVQYWLIRNRLGRYRALTLSILRLCSIFLIISFAFNPSLVEKKEFKLPQALTILIDTSSSMGLSGPGGKGSRLDEAKAMLLDGPKPLLKSLSERFDIRIYALGESLRSLKEEELRSLKAGQKRMDLTDHMKKLTHRNSLAILFSDGNMKWENTHSTNSPVLAVPLGNPKEYKDVLVKALKAPAIGFRGREVGIDVTIKSHGYTGLTLPVILKEESRVLTAKNIRIDETPAETTLSLSFTPEKVGQHNLNVSIPSQFGESLTSNNQVNLSLKVVRDKIRILMISGHPSLSYRFLRMALKNDPSIDLLSFVILRTPSDIINVPIQEQSLIPFPVETLFSKELNHFDLLIFDNLPSHLYISPNYYEKEREFVKEGGGFAMIGGPDLLDEGRYLGTPLGEILPVRLTGKEGYRRDSPFGISLSRAGMTHPITRLSSDEGENLNLWREMPALEGINFLEPKSFKNVLLESADGASRPLLTVSSFGKGRVLILGTDYSWKWYMGMVARGKGNWAYLRFMERMVRWLTKDPSLDPVQIILPESPGEVGRQLEFRIKAGEEGLSQPLKGIASLSIFNPTGMKIGSQFKATGESGLYLGSFLPERGGIYRVKVETSAGYLEEFIVIPELVEYQDASPDHDRLRTVSTSTGGKYIAGGEDLLKEIKSYGERGQSSFIEERQYPLWSMTYTLALILFFLGIEWYLRRKWGLI